MIDKLLPDLNISKRKLILVLSVCFIALAGTAVVLSYTGLHAIYPIVLITIVVFFITNKTESFTITYLDVGFGILLVGEIVTTVFSSYFNNSLCSLNRFLALLFLYFIFKVVIKVFKGRYPLFLLFFFFSFVLLIVTLFGFLSFKDGILSAGFTEIDNFKGYHKPLIVVKIGLLNNIWASALLIFIPFNLILLNKVKSRWQKLIVFVALFLNIFGLIVSFSRGVYLSLLFFVVFLNLFSLRFFMFKPLLIYNLIAVLIVASSALLVKDPFLTTVSLNKTSSQQRSTQGRIEQWKYAINIIDDKPVFGYGQKNYRLAKGNTPLVAEDVVFTNRTNNTYLQILIERGIFGFTYHLFFFMLVLLIVFKNLNSNKRSRGEKIEITLIFAGMAAFLFRELTFSSLFDGELIFFLAFFLIFNLAPYGINIKEIKFKGRQKRVFSLAGIILISLIILLNARRTAMVYYNNKSVENFKRGEIEKSLTFIDRALQISPSDMELHKNKAIALTRSSIEIDISAENEKFLAFGEVDSDALKLSLIELNKILEKTPKNDDILHNTGWIYFALNDKQNAGIYFEKAIDVNPFVGRYHVSYGLYNLYYSNINKATKNIGDALQYSPDILESILFSEFMKKYPENARKSQELAIQYLKERIKSGNNPILKARLARLLLGEDPTESNKLYMEVTSALPNLSRPWVYLAQLNVSEGNTEEARSYYKKARFLGRNDYYAKYNLAMFYKNQNNDNEAAGLFKSALISFRETRNYSYSKYTSIPKMKAFPASYLNTDLLYYIKPKIDASEVFYFLAEYNRKINDEDNATYYENLAEKYKNRGYKGEEKIL